MSEVITIQRSDAIEVSQKRRPGRPRTGFNKNEYMKEYSKEYNKKTLEEKGEAYDNVKIKITEYNTRCRKAYQVLRDLKNDTDILIPDKYKDKIEDIFNNLKNQKEHTSL
jgi:hypothetical protein